MIVLYNSFNIFLALCKNALKAFVAQTISGARLWCMCSLQTLAGVPYLYIEQPTTCSSIKRTPTTSSHQLLRKSMISTRLSTIASADTYTDTDDDLRLGRFIITMARVLPTTPTTVMIGRATINIKLLICNQIIIT